MQMRVMLFLLAIFNDVHIGICVMPTFYMSSMNTTTDAGTLANPTTKYGFTYVTTGTCESNNLKPITTVVRRHAKRSYHTNYPDNIRLDVN